MFQYNSKGIKNERASNTSISKKIDIDSNISALILIDGNNIKKVDLILNKIIDTILDKIGLNNGKVYNNFSLCLDILNGFIKEIKDEKDEINILIAIQEKSNLHFSRIGNTSGYMIKDNEEVIEITNNNEVHNEFSYISSGKLNMGDSIILSTYRLFDFLTKSDILESYIDSDINKLNDNIINILKKENNEQNIELSTIKYEIVKSEQNDFLNHPHIKKSLDILHKIGNLKFIRNLLALLLVYKDKITEKINFENKKINNVIFTSGIIVSIGILYFIIASLIGSSSNSQVIIESKNKLVEAREYMRLANENIATPELFNLNIKKAEELVTDIKSKELFLKDIDTILNDISIIKKQFNGIESFETNSSNILFANEGLGNVIKILENEKKVYIVTEKSIKGPIIAGKEPEEFIFENFIDDDVFIDGIFVNGNISLITKGSKIVNFYKNGTFKYIDVIGQTSGWEKSNFISEYNGNLYLTNEDRNQIFRHKPVTSGYTSGVSYLKEEDKKTIGDIVSIAIDGGIYILKGDLSLYKLFSYPKYRIESIVLNNLPKNYDLEDREEKVEIIARNDLNYVYFFLNNKIWVFQPSSKRYQDVKSLTYIGQIEGKNEKIKGIYINHDGEITVLNDNGIYQLNFEISDDRLIVR